ncbi:MAG: hypothetical protein ACFFB5_18850 [Promethearchaeota archaeon]
MRNVRIFLFCIIIPFVALPINSIYSSTNTVYPIVKGTYFKTTNIRSSIDEYPEGADEINRTLEDQDSYAKSYDLTRSDAIQVYFMIDRSSIDLRLFFHDEEYEVTFEGLSPQSSAYNKTFAFSRSGRAQVAFSNPGVTAGGDNIHIIGYTRLITNGAQEADQVITVPDYKPSIEGWIVVIVVTVIVIGRKYNNRRR